MAIVDKEGLEMLSGSIGNLVFQYQKGVQTVREKPAHYNDRKSEEQLAQRERFKAAQQLYRKVKQAVRGCLDAAKKDEAQRDCDIFISLNTQQWGTMSVGVLPPLIPRIEENCLLLEIRPEGWQKGDILRFIRVDAEQATIQDTLIAHPEARTFRSEPLGNAYGCWIHLRPTKKGYQVSSQQLLDAHATTKE